MNNMIVIANRPYTEPYLFDISISVLYVTETSSLPPDSETELAPTCSLAGNSMDHRLGLVGSVTSTKIRPAARELSRI
jgi:hypothetical protein